VDEWLRVNGSCPLCRKRINDDATAGGANSNALPTHNPAHNTIGGGGVNLQYDSAGNSHNISMATRGMNNNNINNSSSHNPQEIISPLAANR
jgi:hypothetical protein